MRPPWLVTAPHQQFNDYITIEAHCAGRTFARNDIRRHELTSPAREERSPYCKTSRYGRMRCRRWWRRQRLITSPSRNNLSLESRSITLRYQPDGCQRTPASAHSAERPRYNSGPYIHLQLTQRFRLTRVRGPQIPSEPSSLISPEMTSPLVAGCGESVRFDRSIVENRFHGWK